MSFPKNVEVKVLVACRRNCVLCGKFCGTHMELHHIKQRADGGKDSFENCIPLCFDCHADVGSYNSHHPKGKKYSEEELIQRRDLFYKSIEDGKVPHCLTAEVAKNFECMLNILKKLFREKRDVLGSVKGYKMFTYSYKNFRENQNNCTPEAVDELVKWLSEKYYIITDIYKEPDGTINGSIKITCSGISFYNQQIGEKRHE